MAKNSVGIFRFSEASRDQFTRFITSDRADSFAKTFVAKADYQELWPALGCWIGKSLAGAIIWTISKRKPVVANLQLLHTFAKFRRRGVGTVLCRRFLESINSSELNVSYWRVSAEPGAVEFYKSMGIKFLGKQKSGCQLAIAKLTATFEESVADLEDEIVRKAVYRNGKGGCVEVFEKQK